MQTTGSTALSIEFRLGGMYIEFFFFFLYQHVAEAALVSLMIQDFSGKKQTI